MNMLRFYWWERFTTLSGNYKKVMPITYDMFRLFYTKLPDNTVLYCDKDVL